MNRTRIAAIDIMRGLTLFLMLFVNDLYVAGVPQWMVHTEADTDGMGLADWVFAGFLFMVGMAVPLAYKARIKQGFTRNQFLLHAALRTASLLFIGVLMINIGDLNEELTGMNANFWAIGVYLCIFLIWNQYPESDSKRAILFKALKVLGIAGLAILLFIYRSGTVENPGWIEKSWWGILGLIGWGYLVAAIVYTVTQDRLLPALIIWLFFVGLNAASQLDLTTFLDPLNPVFGVILKGNTPSIVLAGLFFGILLLKLKENPKRILITFLGFGLLCLLAGFVLREWFIISKIRATPSWAMICNGVSVLLFALIYLIVDYAGKPQGFKIFKLAGENSLTTYLAPDVIYYLIWGFNLNILLYKQDESQWLAIAGSILWALTMILFAAWLSKKHIRLKL